MKRSTIIGLSIAGVLILWVIFSFNGLAKSEESVTAQWQQVEVAYQARMDKTKNLFEIVQSSADFERGTLKEVIEARSRATSIHIDANDLTPEKIAEFEKAQNQFGASLGRLMAVAENYPQLKTTGAFRDFQAQYEGMENRISTERMRFNQMVLGYNASLRTFPRIIIAKVFGYDKKAYFESQAGAETAPDIKSMRDSERNK